MFLGFPILLNAVAKVFRWHLARMEKEIEILVAKRQEDALYYQGAQLTPDQAFALEKKIDADSDDLHARFLLLGFYENEDRRGGEFSKHVLWIIENIPRHSVQEHCSIFPHCASAENYEIAKSLWLRHLEQNPEDVVILENASEFFSPNEAAFAKTLLERAKDIQPQNPKWSENLAHLYDLGIDGIELSNCRRAALLEQERALSLTRGHSGRRTILQDLPKFAYRAEQYEKSFGYAKQLLLCATKENDSCFASDFKHAAHTVLGLLEIRNGNVERSKRHLLESAEVEGSPALRSFGPSMELASQLLTLDERESVLAYLNRCEKFWKRRSEKMGKWRGEILNGSIPRDWGMFQ